jgi:hypothetical protein
MVQKQINPRGEVKERSWEYFKETHKASMSALRRFFLGSEKSNILTIYALDAKYLLFDRETYLNFLLCFSIARVYPSKSIRS